MKFEKKKKNKIHFLNENIHKTYITLIEIKREQTQDMPQSRNTAFPGKTPPPPPPPSAPIIMYNNKSSKKEEMHQRNRLGTTGAYVAITFFLSVYAFGVRFKIVA